jgi:hypothetical protein
VPGRATGLAISLGASLAIACAPIDVTTTHALHPRPGPTLQLGEQQVDRHFAVDWVQMGPRVLVELHEQRVCAMVSHVPVMRIEDIQRKARGFIAWDFALFGVTGGLAAVAFARPQAFSPRLIDKDGRYVIDTKVAYITGGVFAGIATILLVAGIVNSIKATDETRYVEAYEVDLGPEQACSGVDELPLRERELQLVIADRAIVIEGRSDAQGRARFELPVAWPEGLELPEGPKLDATIAIVGEIRTLAIDLRVPWWTEMIDAHTGRADTRERPLEGPREAPTGFGAGEQP